LHSSICIYIVILKYSPKFGCHSAGEGVGRQSSVLEKNIPHGGLDGRRGHRRLAGRR
jgi:hypothetical protein